MAGFICDATLSPPPQALIGGGGPSDGFVDSRFRGNDVGAVFHHAAITFRGSEGTLGIGSPVGIMIEWMTGRQEVCIMDVNIAGRTLELVEGDITEMETDAIVNAANDRLVLGGGVAGAIRRKGGPQIQAECDKIGGTFVGGAVITTGGRLKARHVIHAVGPRVGQGDEDGKLRNATLNSLKVADENHLKSIAFPAISTGIFGFPIQRCAEIMLATAIEYLRGTTGLQRVVFCLFGEDSYDAFARQLQKIGLSAQA